MATRLGPAFAPRYLKLSRRGDVFTAVDLGRRLAVDADLHRADHYVAGCGGCRHLDAPRRRRERPRAATFTNVTANVALPAGWTTPTLVRSGRLATSRLRTRTYTVNGAGTDLWGTADAFHFAYRSLTGNGTVVARLASVTTPADAAWAMGAIMMRDGTARPPVMWR